MSDHRDRAPRSRAALGWRSVTGLSALALTVSSCSGGDDDAESGSSNASHAPSTIVLINPNSHEDSTQSMVDLTEEEAGDQANVVGVSNEDAPPLLTTPHDMEDAASGVVDLGIEAAADDDVAAIIVSAFSDPGLEELRDEVDVPVFGIGEEAFHAAARDGREFGIVTITPDEDLVDSFQEKADSLGYADQYHGVQVTPGDPDDIVESPDELDEALADAVRESVSSDGSEAVIMGGGPLSEPALRIEDQFEEPLVVAVVAAVDAALEEVGGAG